MNAMLTQDDLQQIGRVIREEVPVIIQSSIQHLVPPMIRAGIDELEERMNVKFDAVHEELESIRNQMVTKDYLDRKLADYVRKPF